jgi:hypothetical protein
VEGSPAYRSLISRYSQVIYNPIIVPRQGMPGYFHILSELKKFSPTAAIKQTASHGFKSFMEALFPILGSTFERFIQAQTSCFQPSSEHQDIKILSQMLLSLQKSTDAYLNSELHGFVVSLPVYTNGQRAKNIDCALAINGFKGPVSYHTSSIGVDRANMGDIADEEKPQMVLAIEHSRTHLKAELVAYDGGFHESLRDEFNTTLGTRQRGSLEHWRDVQALIQRVAGAPYPKCHLDLPAEITRLVLFGDQTEDLAFREVLRTVCLEEGPRMPTKPEGMADPVFAAALGMALTHTMIEKNRLPWDV